MSNKASYWDDFYLRRIVPESPSNFVAWVQRTCSNPDLVLDIGCGNARDSRAWAKTTRVIGVDGSSEAIQAARALADRSPDHDNMKFLEHEVGSESLVQVLSGEPWIVGAKRLLIYARFFLHSVTPDVQAALLHGADDLAKQTAVTCAFEFRTPRDATLAKTFGGHYRRFVDREEILTWARLSGWTILAQAEGQGLTPMAAEDPYVARLLLSHSRSLGAAS